MLIAWFIIMGAIGGFTYTLMKAEAWADLTAFWAVKRVILGAIVGGIYYFLYSEYNFPNMVMSFVSGYMGTDFILALVEKVRKRQRPP